MTRGRKNISGPDLESLRSILLSSKKILNVRTHPEELHASKSTQVPPKMAIFGRTCGREKFFGMSSYDQIFFGTQKYGPSAFQIRIRNDSATSSYFFRITRTSSWFTHKNSRFLGTDFTECLRHPKKVTRGRKNIPGPDLESLRSILLGYKNFLTVRTHPEELCVYEVAHKRVLWNTELPHFKGVEFFGMSSYFLRSKFCQNFHLWHLSFQTHYLPCVYDL